MRHTVILLLLSFPFLAFSQFRNHKLVETTSTADAAGDPVVVINKKNPSNIVAAFGKERIFYSDDSGSTWKSAKVAAASGASGGQASLVSDGKGMMYLLQEISVSGKQQIGCLSSKDNGVTWEFAGQVSIDATRHHSRPWASMDSKGNVWVAWTQFDQYKSEDANCHSNVMLSHSANGRKWSKPIQITQTPGNCKDDDNTVNGATPLISADGRAFVGWANQQKIFLDRSFDGGSLWLSNDIAIAAQSGGLNLNLPGHGRCINLPAVAIDQSKTTLSGSLYAVWADMRSGDENADVWFSRSTNFGDNWSTPMRIGEDVNKGHQYAPALTIDETTGFIYAVFFDRGEYEDNQTDVRLAYSTDGGVSFKTVKISDNAFTPSDAQNNRNLTHIYAHKGIITPVWTQMEGSTSSIWTTVVRQSDLIQLPEASRKKKK